MHWLDITLLFLLGIAILRGYRSGFMSQAIQLGSWVLAWLLADPASQVLIDLFAAKGVTLTMGWVTWLIAFLVVQLLSRLHLKFFFKGVGVALGIFNKVAGALLSLLVTTMALVVMLNCYSALSPRYGWGGVPQQSTIAPEIVRFGETILPTRLLIQKEVNQHLTPKAKEATPADTI